MTAFFLTGSSFGPKFFNIIFTIQSNIQSIHLWVDILVPLNKRKKNPKDSEGYERSSLRPANTEGIEKKKIKIKIKTKEETCT